MGVVHRALDREHGVEVALKVLPTVEPKALLRFKNEFRALRTLVHPNLIRLGELFEESGTYFFSMELLEGEDFLEHVASTTVGGAGALAKAKADATARWQPGRNLDQDKSIVRSVLQAGWKADFDHLRDALRQLCSGLQMLHERGRVHRDLKPSNVFVTTNGRVVLLDFGLVLEPTRHGDRERELLGTVAYMAPEQVSLDEIGPHTDMYALGVLMYETLSGRLPFEGGWLEHLTHKLYEAPEPLDKLAPDAPDVLVALCHDLMHVDPSARPTARQALLRLGGVEATPFTDHLAPFGRQEELERLNSAFDAMCDGKTGLVLLHGESGIGKSQLFRHAIGSLRHRVTNAAVLETACFLSDSVPFRMLDSLLDELVWGLLKWDPSEVHELLPRCLPLLARVFPVLTQLSVLGLHEEEVDLDPENVQQRLALVEAAAELLCRLAKKRPLVLAVDDLHWADGESLEAIRLLLASPECAVLVVGTLRPDPASLRWLPELEQAVLSAGGDVVRIPLEPLSSADAEQMLSAIVPDDTLSCETKKHIVAAAGGHPVFLRYLAQQSLVEGASAEHISLQDFILEQLARLDEDTRRVVEVLALTHQPLAQEKVAIAANLNLRRFFEVLYTLEALQLVRLGRAHRDGNVTLYHSRLRDPIRSAMSPEHVVELSRSLAIAERKSPDPVHEVLARCWRRAGEAERAVRHFEKAGDEATRVFAFGRAARLYAQAIELSEGDVRRDKRLGSKVGMALRCAGRAREAAEVLLATSALGSDAPDFELRRAAADQFFRAGFIEQGLEALSPVLSHLGYKLPRGRRRAVLSLIARRLRLKLRGLTPKPPDESDHNRASLRFNMCWSASMGLIRTDFILAAGLQTESLLTALKTGEPRQLVLGLGGEAAIASSTGNWTRYESLLQAAREYDGGRYAAAYLDSVEAIANVINGHWTRGLALCRKAIERFNKDCHGATWEIGTLQLFEQWALLQTGRLRELADVVPHRMRLAQLRGDQISIMSLRGSSANIGNLVDGNWLQARRSADQALEGWPERDFHIEHLHQLWAQIQNDLYHNKNVIARNRLLERWPDYEAAFIPRARQLRIEATLLRAKCNIACIGMHPDTDACVKDARRMIKRLRKETSVGWTSAGADMLEAGLRARTGAEGVEDLLRTAIASFSAQDMALFANACRFQLAGRTQGTERDELQAQLDTWRHEQRLVNHKALLHTWAPGFRLIDEFVTESYDAVVSPPLRPVQVHECEIKGHLDLQTVTQTLQTIPVEQLSKPAYLLFDLTEVTGYDREARYLLGKWQRTKGHLFEATLVVAVQPAWRSLAILLGITSMQTIETFNSREQASQWIDSDSASHEASL